MTTSDALTREDAENVVRALMRGTVTYTADMVITALTAPPPAPVQSPIRGCRGRVGGPYAGLHETSAECLFCGEIVSTPPPAPRVDVRKVFEVLERDGHCFESGALARLEIVAAALRAAGCTVTGDE